MRFKDGRSLVVKPDTWFTDEKDFDESDDRYEEWECGVFIIEKILSDPSGKLSVGCLIGVTYRDCPVEIRYNYKHLERGGFPAKPAPHCPECGAEAITERDGCAVTYTCPKCGWSAATTEWEPIDLDDTQYEIRLGEGVPTGKENLSLVSHMTGKNFVDSKKIIEDCGVIFVGKTRDIFEKREFLNEQGIPFVIEPDFPY